MNQHDSSVACKLPDNAGHGTSSATCRLGKAIRRRTNRWRQSVGAARYPKPLHDLFRRRLFCHILLLQKLFGSKASRDKQTEGSLGRRPSPAQVGPLLLLLVLLAVGVAVGSGCRAIDVLGQPYDHYQHTGPQIPLPPGADAASVPPHAVPPREKNMVSLPAYQIEPPDLIQIEVLKLVPRPPYRIEIYDVLMIQAVGTLLDQPIDGFYLVEGEGTVNLGPAYGTVRVVGMTIEEATVAIREHLSKILRAPEVSVQLARTAGTQAVSGIYLVAPDGTINLRQYGTVHVAGKTLWEARLAIQQHLSQFFDSPEVSVDMAGYNSKVYYIITEGAGLGDNVVRVPITGNETVLDAISQIGGLSQLSSKEIWIARPAPGNFGCEQHLPVDWVAISRGASTATNYQLMPGDRVFIADDKLIAVNTTMSKLLAPVERLLGISSLGINTVRASQVMGRDYNRLRSF